MSGARSETSSRSRRVAFLDRHSTVAWVAELAPPGFWRSASGEPVGYSRGCMVQGEAKLIEIAVADPVRGQGIGRALLRGFARAVHARGATGLWLDVRPSNEGANRLDRTLGFRAVGRRDGHEKDPLEDALVLRADLSLRTP